MLYNYDKINQMCNELMNSFSVINCCIKTFNYIQVFLVFDYTILDT